MIIIKENRHVKKSLGLGFRTGSWILSARPWLPDNICWPCTHCPQLLGVLSGRHAVPLTHGWMALDVSRLPPCTHAAGEADQSEPEQEALWSLGVDRLRGSLGVDIFGYKTCIRDRHALDREIEGEWGWKGWPSAALDPEASAMASVCSAWRSASSGVLAAAWTSRWCTTVVAV
jgi:hypothetical protein